MTGEKLSNKAVARLIKPAAADAGLDPERFSGHSLRAGLATAAGDQGAGLAELMRQTRHKSTEVALGYLRPADLWRNNVTEGCFGRTMQNRIAPDLPRRDAVAAPITGGQTVRIVATGELCRGLASNGGLQE